MFFGLPYNRALCCGVCRTGREIVTDGNLYGAVAFGDQWYLTRYPVTDWQLSWFNSEPSGGEIAPDFVSALSNVAVPTLDYNGESHRCVGVSGSQYGDGSCVPGMIGESCVWYQLNYVPTSDPEAQPIAALARVVVRDDSLFAQENNPFNATFELSHCWILEDEDGDPWYFDSSAKLCNHHNTELKTLVGPGHFAYQYLRQSGKNQLRYWTPGVSQAEFTEWDDPNVVPNTSGWKALYFDSHCFPVALGSKASTISVTSVQTAQRYFIAGMGNPASGAVSVISEWAEDADENTPELTIGHYIGGTSGGWATLTDEAMAVDVIDWRINAAAGGLQLYYPDDEDESDPLTAFNTTTRVTTGRYRHRWSGYSYQRTREQRVFDGVQLSSESWPLDPPCVKGISFDGILGHVFDASPSGGDSDYRAFGTTSNALTTCANKTRAYTKMSDASLVDATDEGRIPVPMYGASSDYVFVGDDEYRVGSADIPIGMVSGHSTVTPLWGGENISFHEDEIGWYLQNKPPAVRWLIRRNSAFVPDGEEDEWFDWVAKLAHSTVDPPSGKDGWTAPTMERAMWIDDGADGIRVVVRGKYWIDEDSINESPGEAFCYAGVKTYS